MAKELPYYKHEPSEWLEGEIQVCSDAAIVCFTNLRDGYWIKLGCMSYAFALQKYCRKDTSIMQELIDNGIIDLEGDDIKIKFLDDQLSEFKEVSEKRRKAANKRWNDASAMQVHNKSNAIREDKKREDKKREEDNSITKFSFRKSLLSYGVSKELVSDWLKVRAKKKATNSETAFKALVRESSKAGVSINEAVMVCVENSWSGFKADWYKPSTSETPNQQTTLEMLNNAAKNLGYE